MTSRNDYDLECDSVAKTFGTVKAVDQVSFEIPSGTFFSILGPSGCGKTTLIRMIAGFEDPTNGDIRIKGKSVLKLAPNKRNVKMVFQHLALFPMMNVYENIAYGLRCIGTNRNDIAEKVKNVLDRIALPDVAQREVHQLSGGQKQRIAIARCMVLDPDVLLLDEPLGALDLKLRETMKIELKLLQHQFNTTFVYITHDQSEALVMSDQVAVMNQGKFEQIGTPQELYHKPKSAFVAGFVGDTNRWSGIVKTCDNKDVKIETEQGLNLVCSKGDIGNFKIGDKVDVFVRPEFIESKRLRGSDPASESDNNLLCGKVDSVLFNGAQSRILLRGQSDDLIEADVTLSGVDDLSPGDDVQLSWSSDQVMCFKN